MQNHAQSGILGDSYLPNNPHEFSEQQSITNVKNTDH